MPNWYAGTGYRQDVGQEFGPFETREEAENVVRDIIRGQWRRSYQEALGSAKFRVWNIVYEPMPEYTWDGHRWNPNIPWYEWGPNSITSQGPASRNPNWEAIRWRQNPPAEMFLELSMSREDWLNYENKLLNSWFLSDYEFVCEGSGCHNMTEEDWELIERLVVISDGYLPYFTFRDMTSEEYQSASREEIAALVTTEYSSSIKQFDDLIPEEYGDCSIGIGSIEVSLGLEVPTMVRKKLSGSLDYPISTRAGREPISFDWELISEEEYALENPFHLNRGSHRQTYLSYLSETGYKSSPSWDPLEQHELIIQSGAEYLDYMGYAPCAGMDAIYYTMPSMGNYPEFIRWED